MKITNTINMKDTFLLTESGEHFLEDGTTFPAKKTSMLPSAHKSLTTLKIVLVGNGAVGKTTYVDRIANAANRSNAKKEYYPTLGVDVTPIIIQTNAGPICFNIWDCAGREEYRGLGDGYYVAADAAILMFDYTSKASFDMLPDFEKKLEQKTGKYIRGLLGPEEKSLPCVILGNKYDAYRTAGEVSINEDVSKHNYHYVTSHIGRMAHIPYYYNISTNNDRFSDLTKPLLLIARECLKKPHILLDYLFYENVANANEPHIFSPIQTTPRKLVDSLWGPTIHVALIGHAAAGKSTYVQRIEDEIFKGNIKGDAVRTIGPSDRSLFKVMKMETNNGPICFHIKQYNSVNDFNATLHFGPDAALLMYDLTSKESFCAVQEPYFKETIPFVYVGNKYDRYKLRSNSFYNAPFQEQDVPWYFFLFQ